MSSQAKHIEEIPAMVKREWQEVAAGRHAALSSEGPWHGAAGMRPFCFPSHRNLAPLRPSALKPLMSSQYHWAAPVPWRGGRTVPNGAGMAAASSGTWDPRRPHAAH